jgi:hypothetical protein
MRPKCRSHLPRRSRFLGPIGVPAHGFERGSDACPYGTAGIDGCGQALDQWPAVRVAHEYRQLQQHRAESTHWLLRRRGDVERRMRFCSGGDLPAIQYHLASGASSISGTSNFTYQVASVSVAEASRTTNQSQCRDLGKQLYRSNRRWSRNIDRM